MIYGGVLRGKTCMKKLALQSYSTLLAGFFALLSNPASADTAGQAGATSGAADADLLSAIVVTAQRRVENIQDVPISISLITGAQLARQQVVELRDLQLTTSSLQFAAPAGGAPGGGAVIRGIGTVGFSKGAESSVGVVVDGVVQGNTNINNLFDIARVEVLRGPQGTLFGQSTSAGVINITTVAPTFDRVTGNVSSELSGDGVAGSDFGRQVVRAAVNLPISENQAVRISGYANRTTGVDNDVYSGQKDNLKEGVVRARYRAQVGDDLAINLIADYTKSDLRNGDFNVYYFAQPGSQLAALLKQCGVRPGPDNFSNCAGNEDRLGAVNTHGYSAQFDLALAGLTLTSITSYRAQTNNYDIDVDGFPDGVTSLNVYSTLHTDFGQFTQEFRLASAQAERLNYVVGAFFQHATTSNLQPTQVQVDLGKVFPNGPLLPPSDSVLDQHTNVSNASLFGESRLKITDPLTLFAGLRVNRNKVTDNSDLVQMSPPAPTAAAIATFKDTFLSWRAGGEYRVNSSVLFYGSVTRGYKGAQISDANPSLGALVVRPEEPLDFELGVKTNLIDDRLAANVNLFYTRVKDYQAQLCTVDPNAGTETCNALNISRVLTRGVEMDLFGKPIHSVSLNANLLYNPATYPSDFPGLAGQQLAFAPLWKATIAGEYAYPIGDYEGFFSADGTFRSRTRLDIASGADDLIYKRSFVYDARAGIRATDHWKVALFGKNIGNVPVPSSFQGNDLTPIGVPSNAGIWAFMGQQAKRLVGIQGEYDF